MGGAQNGATEANSRAAFALYPGVLVYLLGAFTDDDPPPGGGNDLVLDTNVSLEFNVALGLVRLSFDTCGMTWNELIC